MGERGLVPRRDVGVMGVVAAMEVVAAIPDGVKKQERIRSRKLKNE